MTIDMEPLYSSDNSEGKQKRTREHDTFDWDIRPEDLAGLSEQEIQKFQQLQDAPFDPQRATRNDGRKGAQEPDQGGRPGSSKEYNRRPI